jgi:hypothetical protein
MDKLERYRDIVERVLARHANDLNGYPELRDKTVFDRQSDSYLIVREGWQVVTHLEIINGKIWVQEGWIEHGIAADLEEAGVPKDDIVLGFHPPYVRPDTECAAA